MRAVKLSETILVLERDICAVLNFDLHIDLPQRWTRHLINTVLTRGQPVWRHEQERVKNLARSVCNDMYRNSVIPLLVAPYTIACVAVHFVTTQVAEFSEPIATWLNILRVSREDFVRRFVCLFVCKMVLLLTNRTLQDQCCWQLLESYDDRSRRVLSYQNPVLERAFNEARPSNFTLSMEVQERSAE